MQPDRIFLRCCEVPSYESAGNRPVRYKSHHLDCRSSGFITAERDGYVCGANDDIASPKSVAPISNLGHRVVGDLGCDQPTGD